MRMVNISNEKSMQSYTARCSRYKNKYTNLVCGKTAVGRNYNLPRDNEYHSEDELYKAIEEFSYVWYNHVRPHAYNNYRTPFEARYNVVNY